MSETLYPLDLGPMAECVRAEVSALRSVGEAAELAAALERPGALPAAYVVLEEESFDDAEFTEHGMLGVKAVVAVLIAVRNYRVAERGSAHAEDARALIGATRAALTGFSPPVPPGVVTQALRPSGRAKVLHYDQSVYWWVDRYLIQREVVL